MAQNSINHSYTPLNTCNHFVRAIIRYFNAIMNTNELYDWISVYAFIEQSRALGRKKHLPQVKLVLIIFSVWNFVANKDFNVDNKYF